MASRVNRAAYHVGRAYGAYRYFRYLVPVFIIILSGLAFFWLVFVSQSALFATVSSILWTVAWWKAFYYWEHDTLPMFQDHPVGAKVVGALVGMLLSGASYLLVNLGTGQPLFDIGPPSLLLIMFFIYQADLLFRALEGISMEVTGGAGMSPGMKAVYFGFAVLLVGLLSFQFALGGSWGNLAQVAGPAGSVTADVVQTAADTAATSTNYVINSITESPGFIRMECVLESGGLAGAAFTPSTEITECVNRKLNRSEESEQVTEPVELRLREPQIRPDWRNDRMEVSVEAMNTLVSDIAGRPLNIPARDVQVTATWTWRNAVVARETSAPQDEIQNGNFHIFQFDFPLDRHASDPEDAENGTIAAGFREYALDLNASYTFDAEAAFTDSSRWNTGDNTLKVWDYDAWVSRPDDFREEWADENCQRVAFQDFTYSVQRTGALTTPIMPVVYADCGNRLAQDHADDVDGDGVGDISIDMSATQSDNARSEVSVEQFTIRSAMTDCGSSLENLNGSWPEVGVLQTEFVEAIGWDVTPHRVERNVPIEGESTTISCFLNMSIRVGLQGIQRSGITIRNETVE